MMPRPLCNRNLRPHGVWPRGAQHRPQFPGSFSILYLPSTGRSAYPSDPATLRDHKRRRFAALNDSLRAAIWNLLLPPRPIRSAGSSRVLLVTLSDEKGAAAVAALGNLLVYSSFRCAKVLSLIQFASADLPAAAVALTRREPGCRLSAQRRLSAL